MFLLYCSLYYYLGYLLDINPECKLWRNLVEDYTSDFKYDENNNLNKTEDEYNLLNEFEIEEEYEDEIEEDDNEDNNEIEEEDDEIQEEGEEIHSSNSNNEDNILN